MRPPEAAPPPPLPGGILRRGGGERGGGERQVRFAVAGPGQDHEEQRGGEAPLATPVPNSSRAAAAAARREGGAGPEPFDAPRAAAALLGSSFAARCAVGGAAAGAMNVPPAQRLYRGLISLAVPPPMGRRRGALPQMVPHKVPGPAIGSPPGGEGEPWLPPPAPLADPRPLPRPPSAAFVMYRKLQQWGAG
ncbi:protein phosphatase 1 regulatory subunit 35 [Neopsephotus bourkii]|uniref:protein phosphatase 1 regulatory subunit 35 n=1 Tax=Neopsephotus bourkii TaxID=309878 RepID=UPI002AA5078C|nr:protein phosphatase 1 regulatory subunit 35 [Neopsephotus bourkii]